jgi:hypothetical protein
MLRERTAMALALAAIALLLASFAVLPALASSSHAEQATEPPKADAKPHKAPNGVKALGTVETSTIAGMNAGHKVIMIVKLTAGKKGIVVVPGIGAAVMNITGVTIDRAKGLVNVSATVLRSKVAGLSNGDSVLFVFRLTGVTLKDVTKGTAADIGLIRIEAKI